MLCDNLLHVRICRLYPDRFSLTWWCEKNSPLSIFAAYNHHQFITIIYVIRNGTLACRINARTRYFMNSVAIMAITVQAYSTLYKLFGII